MGDLNSWSESHVTFRNKGSIDVELGFEAFGQSSSQLERQKSSAPRTLAQH
jgi:hypothetical protein